MPKHIDIYTDGSGKATGGVGAAASILVYGSHEREIVTGHQATNHNRMELEAVLQALVALHRDDCILTIYSDSQYVTRPFQEGYIETWRNRHWRTHKGVPMPNADLWQRLYDACVRFTSVSFVWIRGHHGHVYNERCDKLAGAKRKALLKT